MSNFSKLRTYLESEHVRRREGERRHVAVDEERKYAVPRMRDRPGWHSYCLGREQAYGNACGYDDDDDDDDGDNDDHDNMGVEWEVEMKVAEAQGGRDDAHGGDAGGGVSSSDVVATKNGDRGHPPTTTLLLQLDQVLVRAVFHHHLHYLVEWRMELTRDRASWLYALLARMEKPLHREECVGVRMLLRECCRRRWELKIPPPTMRITGDEEGEAVRGGDNDPKREGGAREQLALLNTLIAIAGVYFEQGARLAYGAGGGDGMDLLFSSTRN
ncbi:hypothetical protein ACHAXA_010526 [Cyclostephanos tholiformis]|uniref:Gem-associated protein 2 n=1 Tax=Cyclostephanos tholiformis TaxID=382380 RepID=A0ABD3SQG0_9STRA